MKKAATKILCILAIMAMVPWYALTPLPVYAETLNTEPLSVNIQTPQPCEILSYSVEVRALAENAVSVQFYVDGEIFGTPIFQDPLETPGIFEIVMDLDNLQEGSHIIGAKALDEEGNGSQMAQVNVVIKKYGMTTGNIVLNPSVEDSSYGGSPDYWYRGGWGENTTVLTYPAEGRNGGQGIEVKITDYTSGDAKWYFKDVNVDPSSSYTYSEYYKSDVESVVTVRYTMSDGSFRYFDWATLPASADWQEFLYKFNPIADSVSITVFHLLNKVGTLNVDDFNLLGDVYMPFDQGMVSLDFDDGWESAYDNAIPILNNAGLKSTQYIISGALEWPLYVTIGKILQMQSDGHEIGSHSVNHPDFWQITDEKIKEEITKSKTDLEELGVETIRSLAYPYGDWTDYAISALKDSAYLGARTSKVEDGGYNPANGNPFLLKTKSVDSTVAVSQIKTWIDQALSSKTWLILVFHKVQEEGNSPDDIYYYTPDNFKQVTDYFLSTNAKVITTEQGINEMTHHGLDSSCVVTPPTPPPPPPTVEKGSISGIVFNDKNEDSQNNDGERLTGWTIVLTSASSSTTSATNEQGYYIFEDLDPGHYNVCELLQGNWEQNYPLGGFACDEGTIGYSIELTDGQDYADGNFGNFDITPASVTTGSTGGGGSGPYNISFSGSIGGGEFEENAVENDSQPTQDTQTEIASAQDALAQLLLAAEDFFLSNTVLASESEGEPISAEPQEQTVAGSQTEEPFVQVLAMKEDIEPSSFTASLSSGLISFIKGNSIKFLLILGLLLALIILWMLFWLKRDKDKKKLKN